MKLRKIAEITLPISVIEDPVIPEKGKSERAREAFEMMLPFMDDPRLKNFEEADLTTLSEGELIDLHKGILIHLLTGIQVRKNVRK